ncbi:thioester reductase domain-containing protein [Apiospora saccharicola]
MKRFVMLTSPAKPLPREQGHRAALRLYGAEFKSLFERLARFNPTASGEHAARRQPLAAATSGTPPGSLGKEVIVDGADVLSDEMTLAIEAIVERKVSEALDRLASALQAAAGQLHSSDVGSLKEDTDLFQHGLDSLQVVSLLNAINAFTVKLEQPVDLLEREAIYSNPTVAKLVAVVIRPHQTPPSH